MKLIVDVPELMATTCKMFEEEELMPDKFKPIINEIILNLNDAIQRDADENVLESYTASIKVGDGSTITTEYYGTADPLKLIQDRRVIQVELLGMRFVQKESYEVVISEKKKVCKNLKGVINTK